ncbi:hypothetical protein Lfu02_14760 [Longispora fulva]|uniref:Transcriptional regulator with XRE-family HTH domain n=1 Tax=Longispora fulva TaxID=619741 RepID=A0A8J7GJH5_9ACTN|nr:hypothetical protein [Longispora fulva]MBG6140514.1 transcriptional regulator with XRE-family HTH domain [Longispora fulva]GIG57104.1 hypothetical protein Lfu02_14760 [Longispora fulva]
MNAPTPLTTRSADNTAVTCGAVVRRTRLGLGWSQWRLAKEMTRLAQANGFPAPEVGNLRGMVSKWERDLHVPDGFNRGLLCATLCIDVADLHLPAYEYVYRPFAPLRS